MYLSPNLLRSRVAVNNLKQQLPKYEPVVQMLKINAFFSKVDENCQSFLINQKRQVLKSAKKENLFTFLLKK